MDPQECLRRIIDLVWAFRDPHKVYGAEEHDYAWSQLSDAFDDLAGWLRKGGHAPAATGHIFGMGDVAVGYPGMGLQSAPRFDKRPVTHVRSQRGEHFKYAIMTDDSNDTACTRWVFVEYDHPGRTINRWPLEPLFICAACSSRGFLPSAGLPGRCTFCDGTER